ncbi:MAG: hypothetical protein ABI234_05805 [Ktedonobacteraceae bacterium]
MQTSDHGFEQIMSAVLEQKQVWEKLQAENRELRQQMVDLRSGRGIFVEIMNQRFELNWESAKASPELVAVTQAKGSKGAVQPSTTGTSGVLEEMLLDELSSAMNNRMTTSAERKSSASFNEEQKANLRRELSGSFLLE